MANPLNHLKKVLLFSFLVQAFFFKYLKDFKNFAVLFLGCLQAHFPSRSPEKVTYMKNAQSLQKWPDIEYKQYLKGVR